MSWRRHRRAAGVVLLWAAFNAVLAALEFAFGGPFEAMRVETYWSSVGLLTLVAAFFLLAPGARRPPAATTGAATGAAGLAFAAACLVGGLAWVFGTYLAYLAVPLLAFSIGKLRLERRA